MDASLLLRKFPLSDPPGMSLSDPRFSEMATLIQNGDYPKATALAQSIISEDIFDIRIICYFLFGVFVEHGTVELPGIMEAMKGICTENWEATGPLKNKQKQVKNSFKWFFRQMTKAMTYEEKKQSSQWHAWQDTTDNDTVQRALDLCDELQKIIMELPGDEDSELFDGLSKIKSWLNTFYKLIYKAPEPETEPEPEPDPESDAEDEDEGEDEGEDEISEPDEESEAVPEDHSNTRPVFSQTAESRKKAGTPPVVVPGSSDITDAHGVLISSQSLYLVELLKKMKTFETLIKKKKIAQASLVAFDINAIVNDFDPKRYFPELFARFSLLYAVHIKKIIANREYTETDEWNALQELYKVDIDGFARLDLDLAYLETAVKNDLDFNDPETDGEDSGDLHGDDEDEDADEDW